MARNEKLILVKDLPGAVVEALDAIFAAQGYQRMASQTIQEDFSPLLSEAGGPLAIVLSMPRNEWIACFTSLSLQAEWELAEALARALEQPLLHTILGAEHDVYVYRYFVDGQLHAEALPDAPDVERLDEQTLLAKLAQHGIDAALVDDRTQGFGEEHIVLGYNQAVGREEGPPASEA